MARIKIENLAFDTKELFQNEMEVVVGGIMCSSSNLTQLEGNGLNHTDTGLTGNTTEFGILLANSDTGSNTQGGVGAEKGSPLMPSPVQG